MSVLRTDVRMSAVILVLPQEIVRLRPHSSFVQDALGYVRSDGRVASLAIFR